MTSNAERLWPSVTWEPALSLAVTSPDPFRPARHLPLVVKYGFRVVELYCLYGEDHFPWRSPVAIDELEKVAADLGVIVWSIHASDEGMFSSPDAAVRQQRVDTLRRFVDLGRRLGSAVITCHAGHGFEDGPGRDIARARLDEGLAELCAATAGSGVLLGLETTMGRAVDLPNDLILEHLGRHAADCLAMVLDTGHAHLAGDLPGLVARIGPRLASVHLHDNLGDDDWHLCPGRGTIDWTRQIAELHAGGYRGPLLLEVGLRREPFKRRLERARAAADYLLELREPHVAAEISAE